MHGDQRGGGGDGNHGCVACDRRQRLRACRRVRGEELRARGAAVLRAVCAAVSSGGAGSPLSSAVRSLRFSRAAHINAHAQHYLLHSSSEPGRRFRQPPSITQYNKQYADSTTHALPRTRTPHRATDIADTHHLTQPDPRPVTTSWGSRSEDSQHSRVCQATSPVRPASGLASAGCAALRLPCQRRRAPRRVH